MNPLPMRDISSFMVGLPCESGTRLVRDVAQPRITGRRNIIMHCAPGRKLTYPSPGSEVGTRQPIVDEGARRRSRLVDI